MLKPKTIVPTHKTARESARNKITNKLSNAPRKSTIRIVRGRTLAEIGMASNRPMAIAAQNTEVNKAALAVACGCNAMVTV